MSSTNHIRLIIILYSIIRVEDNKCFLFYFLYHNNDLTANDTRFQFSYSNNKYGYKDSSNNFIPFENSSDATATADKILSGFTAYSQGQKLTGNIAQRSASNITISSAKAYSSGYYPNNWTVTPNGGNKFDLVNIDNTKTGLTLDITTINGSSVHSDSVSMNTDDSGMVSVPGEKIRFVRVLQYERVWFYDINQNQISAKLYICIQPFSSNSYRIYSGGSRKEMSLDYPVFIFY